MKKYIIIASIFALVISVISYVKYFSVTNDLKLFSANVEVLARYEHGSYIRCYDYIASDPTDEVVYCPVCKKIPGRWRGGMNFCIPN